MELLFVFIAASLLFPLAFANGANDVSKGIATLAGAKLTSVRNAVAWGTVWTVAGSLSGFFWGGAIIKNISQNIYTQPHDFYLPLGLAIGIAPTLWIALATWKKWPVSTTHSIVGTLVGSGIMAFGIGGIAWHATLSKIVLPLFASPIIAIALAFILAPGLKKIAHTISRMRVCLTPVPKLLFAGTEPTLAIETTEDCIICDRDSDEAELTAGFTLSVDHLHWLTSGMLSFSRGLNDTPKLIAVAMPFLLLDGMEPPIWFYLMAALAMGAGSLLAGKRITEILGFKVTEMDHPHGFSANFVSTFLVMGASRFGLPVSTTHVSTSSIMGVGLANGSGINRQTVWPMLFAWLITAPVSGLFGALIYLAGSCCMANS